MTAEVIAPNGTALKRVATHVTTLQSDSSAKAIHVKRVLETAVIVGAYQGEGANWFGHVAIAFTGEGVFSYGTNTPLGSSLSAYLQKQATYRASTIFIIGTSGDQIKIMVNYLKSLPHDIPDVFSRPEKAYDTCAARINEALRRAGFDDPRRSPFSLLFFRKNSSIFPADSYVIGKSYASKTIRIPEGEMRPVERLKYFEPKK